MWSRVLLCVALLTAGCSALDTPQTKRYEMPSGSMSPRLKAGDTFEAKVVAAGKYRPTVGDVVVFHTPESWAAKKDTLSVKRVIAVGGFTIACCDVQGRVTVDGVALDEPYIGEDSPIDGESLPGQCISRRFGPVKVEEGQLFLMGDSRGLSMDSRCLGTVAADQVIAVAK